MLLNTILPGICLITAALGAAINTTQNYALDVLSRTANNNCDYVDAIPQLYHTYSEEDCVAPYHLYDGKNCQTDGFGDPGDANVCTSFCQETTWYFYGREVPFLDVPFCRSGLTCTLVENKVVTTKWDSKVNLGVKAWVFSAGISGGFDYAAKVGRSYTYRKDLGQGECGYFTFIPIVKRSCGVRTWGGSHGVPRSCDNSDMVNSEFLCPERTTIKTEDPYWRDMHPTRGIIVFVYTDCVTLLPTDDKQDPAYKQPDVALPRSASQRYADLWNKQDSLAQVSTAKSDICSTDIIMPENPAVPDCMEATYGLRTVQDAILAPATDPGKDYITAVSYGECEVHVIPGPDWDNCEDIKLIEVNAAAESILANCVSFANGDGGWVVENKKTLRSSGKCQSTITMTKKAIS